MSSSLQSLHPGAAWRGAFAGLAALATAIGIGRFAFTPVLPLMLNERMLSIAEGAWLASANYLGYLLGALSAMLVRVPPQRAIRSSLAVIALTTLAMSAPLPFALWAVLRLLAGAASAWVLISVSAWSMDWVVRHRRAYLSGIVFAGVGCGIAGAGLLCMAFDGRAASAWGALGVAALAATLLVWNGFADGAAPVAPGGRIQSGWNGEMMRLVASYALFGFGYIIPATFLPVIARQVLGAGTAFAWAWPLFGLAAALSVLPVAYFVRRIGNRGLWLCGHLVMAAGIALPLAGAGMVTVLGSALAVGGTFMVVTLVALQEARAVAGSGAPGLMAAMTAAFAAGQIVGPLSVGDRSFSASLALAVLALLAGAALLAWPARLAIRSKE